MKNNLTRSRASWLAGGVFLLLFACHDNEKILPSCDGAAWEYGGGLEGPGQWQNICIGYGACGGEAQSPVNIAEYAEDSGLTPFFENYTGTQTHIVNKDHTLRFDQDPGSGGIVFEDQEYQLLQFHVHTPGEHTVGGKSYPMEVHLAHRNEATGALAYVAVLVEEGAENAFLASFTGHLPAQPNETYDSPDAIYNPADLLPADRGYFTYKGSLTAPPCTENVTWIVLEHPVQATLSQINKFGQIVRPNNRPLQQLNGRVIRHFHQ